MEHQSAAGIYVAIHGHFYQPPRENPYLETIERQPSAHPDRDWNERIYRECYRPNTCARVFNAAGETIDIVNNFEYLSFNVGPTLLSWLERHDVEVYQRILAADRRSCARLDGHGNAIAQAYNHAILPLANSRDRRTQILWGIADFQGRFGRQPEGMWLPETAVDYPTLEALAAAGMRFAILAPSQAARCRPLESDTWLDVKDSSDRSRDGGRIDSTRPYRCYLPDGGQIDLFFYDGASAREIAFGNLLHSAEHLSAQLARSIRLDRASEDQLLCVATDGETFGHHKPGGERCLAYAFTRELPARGWIATNFAHYLSTHPPTWEVEIVPATAWSCAHGLGRWQRDCGCGGAGAWRQPLRESLDWLRDRLAAIYETYSAPLLQDPWQARDAYAHTIGDRATATAFLVAHQRHALAPIEATQALCLLEMQRQSLLMYSSCGWFFEEISRPEGVQILRYAARAIDLATRFIGAEAAALEAEFLSQLAMAPSNLPAYDSGADVYRQLAATARVEPAQVAVHCLMAALLGPEANNWARGYCYRVDRRDYYQQHLGERAFAMARYQLVSDVTWERHDFVVALLHLDDWDMRASVMPWDECPDYRQLKETLICCFVDGEATIAAALARHFGERTWGVADIFGEERHRILQQLGCGTQIVLERAYERAYGENQRLLAAFQGYGLPVPPELELAAEVVLSRRCDRGLQALERGSERPTNSLQILEAIMETVAEAERLHCRLRLSAAGRGRLRRLLWHALRQLLAAEAPDTGTSTYAGQLVEVARKLQFQIGLDCAQEWYCQWLQDAVARQGTRAQRTLTPFLSLGKALAVDVEAWLQRLPQAPSLAANPLPPSGEPGMPAAPDGN